VTSVHCPKCRAGRGALEARLEHLENGTVLQTVRCVLCGERRSRALSRYRPLAADPDPAAIEHRQAEANPRDRRCAVVGCGRKLNGGNHSGFCTLHGKRWHNWVNSKRTRPAPLLPVGDGRYMVNPARGTQEVTA